MGPTNPADSRIRPGKYATDRKRIKLSSEDKAEFVSHESPCQVLDECRACSLLDVDYRKQIKIKSDALREQFKTNEDTIWHALSIPDCVPSQQRYAYRHTAKLVVSQRTSYSKTTKEARKWLSIGLYKPGTHEVVDIGSCPVQAPHLNAILGHLRKAIKSFEIEAFNEVGRTGDLRYVVLRHSASTRQTLVTFISKSGSKPLYLKLAREMMEQFSTTLCGVLLHKNDSVGNAIFQWEDAAQFASTVHVGHIAHKPAKEDAAAPGETVLLSGNRFLLDEVAGLRLRVSAESFMQVNPGVAERMYHRIVELCDLAKSDNVLDLYCGVGALTLLLAENCRRVVGIEESAVAIEDARTNSGENKVPNIDFVAGRAENVLGEVIAQKLNSSYQVVTLNPSRRGCQKIVLQKIAELAPRRIVYMSCSTQTLLRDGSVLAGLGYRPLFLEPHDMFPGTSHVECICVFEKQ